MKFLIYLASLLRFSTDFGNPVEIFFTRLRNPKGNVRVIDRASKLQFQCKVASYQMFGEVWHDRDYDVPRIAIRPQDLVVDIGANQGFYTCYAAKFGARVVAFEPVPQLFQTLLKNVDRNGFTQQVTANQSAVSDTIGPMEMILSDTLGGGMNTIVGQFAKRYKLEVTERIQVPTLTFEAILAENKIERMRICKMDCEGAEFMILETIKPEMAKKVDAFVIEYHYRAGYGVQDLVQVILNWGTHQVSYAEDKKYCERMIVRAVRTDLLTEGGPLPQLASRKFSFHDADAPLAH